MPKFEVIKDFDFAPRANVVQNYKAGEIRSDLTRACVAKGKELGALKPLTKKGK